MKRFSVNLVCVAFRIIRDIDYRLHVLGYLIDKIWVQENQNEQSLEGIFSRPKVESKRVASQGLVSKTNWNEMETFTEYCNARNSNYIIVNNQPSPLVIAFYSEGPDLTHLLSNRCFFYLSNIKYCLRCLPLRCSLGFLTKEAETLMLLTKTCFHFFVMFVTPQSCS